MSESLSEAKGRLHPIKCDLAKESGDPRHVRRDQVPIWRRQRVRQQRRTGSERCRPADGKNRNLEKYALTVSASGFT